LNKGKFKKIEYQICFSHIYTKFFRSENLCGAFQHCLTGLDVVVVVVNRCLDVVGEVAVTVAVGPVGVE